MRGCRMHRKKQLGCLMAFGGVLLVFVCLPMEYLLIVLGASMTAVGIVLLWN